jgi:hypothetical protein
MATPAPKCSSCRPCRWTSRAIEGPWPDTHRSIVTRQAPGSHVHGADTVSAEGHSHDADPALACIAHAFAAFGRTRPSDNSAQTHAQDMVLQPRDAHPGLLARCHATACSTPLVTPHRMRRAVMCWSLAVLLW